MKVKKFLKEINGIFSFINKNGVEIDNIENYPEVEVLNVRKIEGEQYEIILNI